MTGDKSFQCFTLYRFSFREVQISQCHKEQIFILQSTGFHLAKYRFSFRKVKIFISQSTDFILFRFVSQSTILQSTIRPAFRLSIFGKRDKHSCSAPAIISSSMASVVDSSLSMLHASAYRIFVLGDQCIFHWLWLCGQSLFFFSGCRPGFWRLAASPLDARTGEEELKKKRDCSQSRENHTA